MIKLTLKDGSIKEVEIGTTIFDLANSISEGLARVATSGIVNGKIKDLRYELKEDAEVSILTFEQVEGKKAYWHTTAHVMAQAVKRIYGENVELTIGPSIDNGFYYDFDTNGKNISSDDFEKIEDEMKKIIKEDLAIEKFILPKKEALEFVKNEPYKVELIEELPEGEEISFYKQGEFTDLCARPSFNEYWKSKSSKNIINIICILER